MEARKKRKDEAADTLAKFGKVYNKGRKVRVEAYAAEWCDLRERVASLTGNLESWTSELPAIPGLGSEAAWLRHESAKARKNAVEQDVKLSSSDHVLEEVSTIKEDVSKLLSSSTQAGEHRVNQEALVRQREIDVNLSEEREKTLDFYLAFVKNELANVKVHNMSLC